MHECTKQQEKRTQPGANPTHPEHSHLNEGPRVNKPTTNTSHFSCLGRTRQEKRNDCVTSSLDAACANAPAVGHHATTWRSRRGDGPPRKWPRISTLLAPLVKPLQVPSCLRRAAACLQLGRSSLALREILREEKRRHECCSNNKREVTAWESSPNQIARIHKTTRKTRTARYKSYTSRTQPLE